MTDVTNASRTMLLNLESGKWDESICKELSIPLSMLPEIKSSSEIYGYFSEGPLKGVPISSVFLFLIHYIILAYWWYFYF